MTPAFTFLPLCGFLWGRLATFFLLGIFLCAFSGGKVRAQSDALRSSLYKFVATPMLGGSLLPVHGTPGRKFAIAYVSLGVPNLVQVRTSIDGSEWSNPSILGPSTNLSPGIGASDSSYLVAWFDLDTRLNTAQSTNGRDWEFRTRFRAGRYSGKVDQKSIPSVAYNPRIKSWFIAYRTNLNTIHVLNVDGPNARPSVLQGVSTREPPAFAWTSEGFLIVYKDLDGHLRTVTSADGYSWSASENHLTSSIGDPILLDGAPYLGSSAVGVWLATTKPISSGGLSTNQISVYKSDANGWSPTTTLNRTSPYSERPAVIGSRQHLVIADIGIRATTDIWRNGQRVEPISTNTWSPVSMAQGPRSASLPDIWCGPCNQFKCSSAGNEEMLRDCTLRAGGGKIFRCATCAEPVPGNSSLRRCKSTSLASDAPGYSEDRTWTIKSRECGRENDFFHVP